MWTGLRVPKEPLASQEGLGIWRGARVGFSAPSDVVVKSGRRV